MKKFYQVGELAQYFGVTRDTIRLYDKMGILSPKKSENGYRVYSREEFIAMDYIMLLRQLDIPLKQIKGIVNDGTIEDTVSIIKDYDEQIENQLRRLSKLKKMIEDYEDTYDAILEYENRIVEKTSPEFLYKPINRSVMDGMTRFNGLPETGVPKYTFVITKEQFLSRESDLRITESEWRDEITQIALTMPTHEKQHNLEDLSKRGIELLAPRKCLYTIVKTHTAKDYSQLLWLRDEVIKKGIPVTDQILNRLILINNIDKGGTAYYECWIPIE